MTRRERAKVINKGSSLELIKRMAGWIAEKERQKGSWVVGLYGERGAGKTSLLLTLLEELNKGAHRLVLPTAEDGSRSLADIRNLLKPAALRAHDDLLFDLLRHLGERYGKLDQKGGPFEKAREIEVMRKDIDRFLKYAEEVGTSKKDLEKQNITIREDVASGTIKLREQFKKIVAMVQRGGEQSEQTQQRTSRTLVLLVDDIDLHPERALDLLEMLHIFLDQDGVVIVLAADKPLLLDSINLGLKKTRGLNDPDLAAALLAKYVPYEWHIPVLTGTGSFNVLWPFDGKSDDPGLAQAAHEQGSSDDDGREDDTPSSPHGESPNDQPCREPEDPPPELHYWWPLDTRASTIPRLGYEVEEGEPGSIPPPPSIYKNRRELAEDLIGLLLPASYRGTYRFENRLRHVRKELGWGASDNITLSDEQAKPFGQLKLFEDVLPAFLTGVLAFDTLHPRHLLWNQIRAQRDAFDAVFYALAGDDRVAVRQACEKLLHGAPRLRSDERRRAEEMLKMLARMWTTLNQQPVEAPRRFLALSFSLDALEKAKKYWEGRHRVEQVKDWHIDLRRWVDDPDNVAREEMLSGRKEAQALLREKNIPDASGGVDVFLKANLPFVVWLGWKLRKLQDIKILNERDANFTPFSGAGKELKGEGATEPRFFEKEQKPGSGPDNKAVLLIDVLNKSTPEQLDAFRHKDGSQVEYGHGIRLLKRLKGDVLPEHTEPFLRDCVETLGQLKRQGISHVHLGLAMPDTLAFLLGQQLHARVDRVSLYEYRRTEAVYEYIFDLEEP